MCKNKRAFYAVFQQVISARVFFSDAETYEGEKLSGGLFSTIQKKLYKPAELTAGLYNLIFVNGFWR